MKICIITVYNSENCGSYLQAYALKKKLEVLGHQVCFLQRDTKGTSHDVIRHITESMKRIAKFRFPELQAEWIKYQNFNRALKKFNTIIRKEEIEQIDLFIIGSDTIWNFDSKYFYENKDRYLGKEYQNKRVVTYAASIANTKYETLLNDERILDGIKQLNRISVRDQYTKTIVEDIIKKEVCLVVDPTLLLDSSEYYEIEAKNDYKGYILLYMFGKIDSELKREILKYKRKYGKKVVSFGDYREWADLNVVYDPFQFLYFFRNADCIITNTFHGTIFSITYNKRFADFGAGKKKIVDLLEQLGLSGQICHKCQELETVLNKHIEYNLVRKKIEELRKDSINYLCNAIEGE